MMSKWKTWICGGALAAATVMSLAAWSMGPGEGMHRDPTRMITHMSERLDLSSEQQGELESLLQATKETSAADRARMHELRGEMMAMKDNWDAGKAQAIADEIGQLTGRMVFQVSQTFAQVYQVLTVEQKAELESLMAKRNERRGKWGGGHGQ